MRQFLPTVILSVLFSVYCQQASGQTIVGGIIAPNTVWDTAGSPYLVTSVMLVPDTASLHILPGVSVIINGGLSWEIFGELRVVGTVTDSIHVTVNDVGNGNDYKIFVSSVSPGYDTIADSGTRVSFCTFTGLSEIELYSPIMFSNNRLNATQAPIGGGLHINNAFGSTTIMDNIITGSLDGIVVYTCGNNCSNSINIISGNTIDIAGSISLMTSCEFSSNLVLNTYVGVGDWQCPGGQCYGISNNCFRGASVGLSISVNDSNTTVSVSNNAFENNGQNLSIAGSLFSNQTVAIHQNNFLDYGTLNLDIVTAGASPGNYESIDMSNNYWGGLDSSQIDISINDFQNDVTLGYKIEYQPTLPTPAVGASCPCVSPVATFQHTDLFLEVTFTNTSIG